MDLAVGLCLITNRDEEFQQRWEYRKGLVDADSSSDDNKSNSSGEPTDNKHDLVTDLVLPENDDVIDTLRFRHHDNLDSNNAVEFQCVGAAKERKIKSSMKKNAVQNKLKKCSVKENKKKQRNLNAREMVAFEDLKFFSDSLIHELQVARENMFAQMREEMKKLIAYRFILGPKKKNASCSKKNEVHFRNGIESGMKPQNYCGGSSIGRNVKSSAASDVSKFSKAIEAAVNHDKILETTNELDKGERLRLSSKTLMVLANDSDSVVSSPYLTLPTVVPKPQFQNDRNGIPLNDHIPAAVPRNNSVSKTDIGRLMDAKYYHRFPGFQQEEQFGNFSCKSGGFLGQNCFPMTSMGVGFPTPLQPGMDNGSKMSNQIYPENSFMDSIKIVPVMNCSRNFLRGSPASSECILPSSISSNMHHKTDGVFVPIRSQDLKDGHFYLASLRNE